MFTNSPRDQGSFPGRVIPKTHKMVLNASLLNTQYYKLRIKDKVEQWSSALPTQLGVVAIENGSSCHPQLRSPTYMSNRVKLTLKWLLVGWHGISTFVAYLMPNLFLWKLSILFQTIQFSMSKRFVKNICFKLLIKCKWCSSGKEVVPFLTLQCCIEKGAFRSVSTIVWFGFMASQPL